VDECKPLVGGYVATRFMPLAAGCGGAVKSLAVVGRCRLTLSNPR
jgi:hypothetical protein